MKKIKQIREELIEKKSVGSKKEKITINPSLRVLKGLKDKVGRGKL